MTQTVTLKVSIDCEACKKKVKKALDGIQGVETIDVDMKNEKVTVVGSMDPKVLVKQLEKKAGKKVVLPGGHAKSHFMNDNTGNTNNNNNDFSFPNNFNFGKGGHNRNGLKGRVVSVNLDGDDDDVPTSDAYSHIFSDENANSCSIM